MRHTIAALVASVVLSLIFSTHALAGSCTAGTNLGEPCIDDTDCPDGTCGNHGDHLECYKVADTQSFSGVVDVDTAQFGLEAGCKIKLKAALFCAPADKRVVDGGGAPAVPFGGQALANDRICYKVKCPTRPVSDRVVTDQFGTRTLRKVGKAYLLCTPAMKGAPPVPCPDDCPDKVQITLFAGAGAVCTTNADCPVGTCDSGVGRCLTVTELDLGWTGLGFDQDIDDRAKLSLNLACPGGGMPGPCGNCAVTGWNCEHGTCRCANDLTIQCTMPFALDPVCGGSACNVYATPPIPISHNNTPSCVVSRLATSITGALNIDSGAANLDVSLKSDVYLGISVASPCPYCNDPTPGNGVADGVCVGGANDTGACDAAAVNTSFPALGGDGASLDCPPDPPQLVSGAGLQTDLSFKNPRATSLGFNVPCSPPLGTLDCACAVCSLDNTIPCNDDATCIAAGAGLCNANGTAGAARLPNGCSTLSCLATGVPVHAEDGSCDNPGPDDSFCDTLVRANDRGFVACLNNTDCALYSAGTCTFTERRECFRDPITAFSPATDASHPVITSVFCIPPTTNAAINVAAGYPGPGRAVIQTETFMTCPSDPSVTYTPGVGF